MQNAVYDFCDGKLRGTIFEQHIVNDTHWTEYKMDCIRIEFGYKNDTVYRDIDSGSIDADLNKDGNVDYCDIFEILMYYKHTATGGTKADYYDESIAENIIANGDFNNDSSIDAADASAVLSYYAASSVNVEIGFETVQNMNYLGDYNNDGCTDSRDASMILAEYAESSVQ